MPSIKHRSQAVPALRGFGAVFALLLIAAALALAAWSFAHADSTSGASVFQVTKTDDTADGICDTDCSLREAIIAANTDDDASTINLPANAAHYLITNGLGDDGSLQGDFDILTTVTITGASSAQTIVDGNAADTVFQVHDEGYLTLQDLTVRNGKAIGDALGGGIFAEGALTLDRATVSDNAGPDFGAGGVYATARVTLKDATIDHNSAGNEGVGGVFTNQEAEIDGSTISNNSSAGTNSVGGLSLGWNSDLGDITISGNHTSGESSTGGLYSAFGEEMEVHRATISDNSAAGNFAVGGWWNAMSATAVNLVIDGNTGGDHGTGGVFVECCSGGLELSRAAVTNNIGGDDAGGGIWNESEAVITNVTVSGNSAGASGAAGVYNGGVLTLVNVTIADNTPGSGGAGGLWIDDPATVRNTNVAADCIITDTLTSEGGNISLHAGCGFTDATDHENTDPLLGPLSDNGGFSQTRKLLTNSPAIGAAVDCPPPDTDQRGVERPANACDSGAYQLGEFAEVKYKWGDIRCDGTVTPLDVTDILAVTNDHAHVSAVCPAPSDRVNVADWFDNHFWGDVNCDNSLDPRDALFILRHLAQVGVTTPGACPTIGQLVSLE